RRVHRSATAARGGSPPARDARAPWPRLHQDQLPLGRDSGEVREDVRETAAGWVPKTVVDSKFTRGAKDHTEEQKNRRMRLHPGCHNVNDARSARLGPRHGLTW